MSQAGITLDAAFRATHSAQATWHLASVQVESTWISLLMNNLTLSTVSMPNSMVFLAWCLLDSIYCISWYTSTSLMNWAAPYFCQHSHKCTKNVRPVVGVSLAGTTLDAAFRATHPAQATCDHIDISTYLCIYISIYLYIVIWHWRGMHGSCAQGTKNTCRAKKSLRHTANVYIYIHIYICMH